MQRGPKQYGKGGVHMPVGNPIVRAVTAVLKFIGFVEQPSESSQETVQIVSVEVAPSLTRKLGRCPTAEIPKAIDSVLDHRY